MCFSCEDCIHYKDGKCDAGREVGAYEDSYDCTVFEDKEPV